VISHVKAWAVGSNFEPGHWSRLVVLVSLALAAVTVLAASPALGASKFPYSGTSFGPGGTSGSETFAGVQGVAVDQASGAVYVLDSPEGKVYKFDSSGEPADFPALSSNAITGTGGAGNGENELAVAPAGAPGGTAGDIYLAVGNEHKLKIYAPSGAELGAIATGEGEVCGVATSPAGHVFIGIYPETVREYVPTANPVKDTDLAKTSSASLPQICNVAADGLGNVYAASYNGGGGVVKLEGIADPSADTVDPAASTMAVDPSTNDLFADRGDSVFQYDSAGNLLSHFGSGLLSESHGVGVNGSSGKVYVGGASGRVAIFGPAVLVPTVSAQSASSVSGTAATLNGTVNPEGLAVTECKFEYGTSSAYGSTKPCEGSIPTDGNDHPVTAALTGLDLGATYHFRVVATNANGTNESNDETFTTKQPAGTEAATGVGAAKATLNGTVLPEGEAVSECFFQYGANTNYGKKVACEGTIPTDEGSHPVSAALAQLKPGTTYHFRLVIVRGSTTIPGPDETFTTGSGVVTGGASAITPPTATVEGTVNPDGTLLSSCEFEYGTSTGYGQSAPCAESPASIGSGESPVPVHAALSGISFGDTYHYRLVASSANGTFAGEDASFQTPGATIAQRVLSVTLTEAALEAEINPAGSPTTYHLEYGTGTSYGTSTPETFVGEDGTGHAVTESLQELDPGTTYHFRFVATNGIGTTFGADRTFTTFVPSTSHTGCPSQAFRVGPGANLPDCRAYEQATPTDKHGANTNGTISIIQASRSGDRITFADPGGLPTTGGSTSAAPYVASRGSSDWSSNGLLAPSVGGGRVELLGWDEEIAVSVSSESRSGISLGDTAGRSFQQVISTSDRFFPNLAGFAEDPSHFAFESEAQLTPGALSEKTNLYDFDNGALTLVGRVPAGAATSCDDDGGPACVVAPEGAFAGPYNWQDSNLNSFGGASGRYYVNDAISRDGSKVFFTAAGSGQLYVREGGTSTTRVSASQASVPDPNGSKPAVYLAATPNGSKVFFASCEKLTDDSTAVSTTDPLCTGEEQGQDLYSFDTESGELSDLTVDSADSDPRGAAVVGVLGSSGDGSYLYFVANGVLAPGAKPGRCRVNGGFGEGDCNLYLYHAGATSFIAGLHRCSGGCDWEDWAPRTVESSSTLKQSRVSSNGVLLFRTAGSLTGYENRKKSVGGSNSCGQGGSGEEERCNEYYRFDPTDEKLSCVTCDPTGAMPIGGARLESSREVFEATTRSAILTRNISSDGSRIFFDSPDPLVPEDTNGVVDPYEWEADGSGSCESSTADGGCLYLLSSGTNPNASFLGDVSASGNDAFIFTGQQLVPTDKDQLTDVYDARVGGGLASQNPPPAAPPCEGEACKGAGTTAPGQPSPGSASFSGPGNQHEKPRKRCEKHGKKCKKSKKKHQGGKKKHRGAHRDRGGSK
jgi:hypothetical protein